MGTRELFTELFCFLDDIGYLWHPLPPHQLIKYRKENNNFSKLCQYLGLGIPINPYELETEGFPVRLIPEIDSLGLAISRTGNFYTPHSHWPSHPRRADHYVYFGQESLLLTHQLYRSWNKFKNKRILDLGCGSGTLAIELSQVAKEILGLDSSSRAIEWATISADVQARENVRFAQLDIKFPHRCTECSKLFDCAVFNPPLAIPKPDARLPYRDGGKLGIELPLQFLDFAEQHLVPEGEAFCLMTSPIQNGRLPLFDELKKRKWNIQEQICLNSHFNAQLSRTDRYMELGIERIELYYFRLARTAL